MNDYILACRTNKYAGASMKKKYEQIIGAYLKGEKYENPIQINFTWVEGNKRRDYDNISSGGRKFILDAMVKCGVLKDDNRKYVVGFSDKFEYSEDKSWKVIMEIKEVENVEYKERVVESWWVYDRGTGDEFCAMCGEQKPEGASNFCPNCGCKMREIGEGIESEVEDENND